MFNFVFVLLGARVGTVLWYRMGNRVCEAAGKLHWSFAAKNAAQDDNSFTPAPL
jgi:hypothetical protein